MEKKINKAKISIELFPQYSEEINKLIIKIYYLPKTEYNSYKYDTVIFYIELNEKNLERPKITCHSKVKLFFIFTNFFYNY